jgi:hypothetical protein
MDELGAETLDLVVDVASGHKSVGEKAGHSQVQLWRNWRQVSGHSIVDDVALSFAGTLISFS